MDRRVARTRAVLQRAHLALMLEKGYDAVTVEDICNAADVGRSTFYAHFTGKEDLHRSGLEALRRQLVDHRAAMAQETDPQPRRGFAFSLPMFAHARDHLDLYRALIGNRGGVMALDSVRQMLVDVVRHELPAVERQDEGAASSAFAVQYLVGAYLSVLTWWLDDGAKLSPEDMDAMFQRLACEGLAGSGGEPARARL